MSKLGMNTDQGRTLAKQLKAEGERVTTIAASLGKQVQGVDWTGPDATRFKGSDWKGVETTLKSLGNTLTQLSTAMNKHIADQEAASRN